jgi:hypothetical protein
MSGVPDHESVAHVKVVSKFHNCLTSSSHRGTVILVGERYSHI